VLKSPSPSPSLPTFKVLNDTAPAVIVYKNEYNIFSFVTVSVPSFYSTTVHPVKYDKKFLNVFSIFLSVDKLIVGIFFTSIYPSPL
jgi:hypothetical protein